MAGFIPEITTRVTVDIDVSAFDDAIDLIDSDEILSEIPSLKEELEDKKTIIQNFKTPLGLAVSQNLQSNQEMIISSKHYITGLMAGSVDIMGDGDDYLVGNTAMSVDGFPYPLAIETGRREIYPISAKVLRWFEGGDFNRPVFARYASSVEADPFVEPSIDDTMWDIDFIIDDFLEEL